MSGYAEDAGRLSVELSIPDDLLRRSERPLRAICGLSAQRSLRDRSSAGRKTIFCDRHHSGEHHWHSSLGVGSHEDQPAVIHIKEETTMRFIVLGIAYAMLFNSGALAGSISQINTSAPPGTSNLSKPPGATESFWERQALRKMATRRERRDQAMYQTDGGRNAQIKTDLSGIRRRVQMQEEKAKEEKQATEQRRQQGLGNIEKFMNAMPCRSGSCLPN